MIPAIVRTIGLRLILLLAAYGLCRLFFLYWNWGMYAEAPPSQILLAFFYGLRFDLAAILFMSIPTIPFWFLPSAWLARPWLRRTELTIFITVHLLGLGLNVMDAEYFKFIGKRNSYDLLFLRDDIRRQIYPVLMTYWYLALFAIPVIAALIWIVPRYKADGESLKRASYWAWRIALLVFAVVGMRGGLQFKPLHPMHAYFSTRHELGLLTLNTPFNIIRSKPRGELRRERYFDTNRAAIEHLNELTRPTRPPLGKAKGFNVVVLVLESFSLEYVGAANDGRGYTPFLDRLAKNERAYFFAHNFANARRSIEGLPAVLCGLPAMMSEPILTSDFSNNRMDCLPRLLAKQGYSSYFLHGAHNGSMHFDTFSKIAGFETFIGLNEFPKDNKEDFDEYWGVLDEPMLQYTARLIDEAKKPVMVGVFTLSSHSPYYVPPKYAGKFPKGTLEIHETIGYTDFALEQFFKTAETKPWFKNTIFVITADHTQKTDQKAYQDLIGPWRVPLFIYIPGLEPQSVDRARVTQHADIIPSVMDLIGVDNPERLLVGQSVFDMGLTGRVVNFTHFGHWYMDHDTFVNFGYDGSVQAYRHRASFKTEDLDSGTPEAQDALTDLKAMIHYFNEGLLGNSLHSWRQAQ